MKGISPLIASVILIAITLAIAGILATFATQLVGTRSTTIQQESECIGALNILSTDYSNGQLRMGIFNAKSSITLQNLTALVIYPNASITPVALNISLGPTNAATVNISSATKPQKVRISAINCGTIQFEAFIQ